MENASEGRTDCLRLGNEVDRTSVKQIKTMQSECQHEFFKMTGVSVSLTGLHKNKFLRSIRGRLPPEIWDLFGIDGSVVLTFTVTGGQKSR